MQAATRLFVSQGYQSTTMPAIAAEAGVSVETVYRSADGKAGLLSQAIAVAVAGSADNAHLPASERPAIQRIISEPDPARQLRLYAVTQPGVWSRVSSLLRVLDAAASTDPSLSHLRQQLASQRRDGLRDGLGRLLHERGALRAGLTATRAGDIVYTVCGRANFDALVEDCGWSEREYVDWLTASLISSLLPGPDDSASAPPDEGGTSAHARDR